MALPVSTLPSALIETRREHPAMSILPILTDEERAEMSRRRREDEEQTARLNAHLEAAMRAIEEAQKELRRPLDSVRWDDNDAR